ncbi:MAG: hypothetical protein WDM96_01765 [Lacunisphaera sp.]
MLGAMSKIVQDVPPFIIADGNAAIARSINKVGLERHEFTPERLDSIKNAFRLFYRSATTAPRPSSTCARASTRNRPTSSTSSISSRRASAAWWRGSKRRAARRLPSALSFRRSADAR